MRDAAALCAVLPAAFVLSRGSHGEAPLICRHLQRWGLACEKLPLEDALVAIERGGFLRLLVEAGAAPFIWSSLRLAIVHLCIPHLGRLNVGSGMGLEDELAVLSYEAESALPRSPWEDAKCFWYDVTQPAG